MDSANPRSTARILGHPIHPMLVPYPIALFTGALVADVAYTLGERPFWAEAGFWLLVGGLAGAGAAALAGFADFLGDRRVRGLGTAWQHMLGNVTLVVLEAINLLLRVGDPTAPLPTPGILLSAAAFLLLGFTGWRGGDLVYRHRVGIPEDTGTA